MGTDLTARMTDRESTQVEMVNILAKEDLT